MKVAQRAGRRCAGAVIVMNEGQPGRTGLINMIGDATGLTIPAVFTTFAAGADLASDAGSHRDGDGGLMADVRTAWNVIAETATGNDDNVVMAGAHLDSVQDGPGINDNGSGSAALLETAIQMSKVKPNNTVRFAWWGAEESGLLGSEHYVAELTDEQIADIALYLNFDMIGSPNYMFGIYDGDNSGGTAAPGFIPAGIGADRGRVRGVLRQPGSAVQGQRVLGSLRLRPVHRGRHPGRRPVHRRRGHQDRRPGGSGTAGSPGVAYDPCYHSVCDNLTGDGQPAALYAALNAEYDLVGNINTFALDVNSDAVAAAIITFAFDTSTVNAVSSPGKSHGRARAWTR